MTTMGFHVANATFRQLHAGGPIYESPAFQGDYSWTEGNWNDLWQDCLEYQEKGRERLHYMGYLVLQPLDKRRFVLFDGQQRITSISLMILAALGHLQDLVADSLDAENNARRKNQLQNSYILYHDPVSLVSRPRLQLGRNNTFYQTCLATLDVPLKERGFSAPPLPDAFLWFRERIKAHAGKTTQSGKELALFVDRMVDRLLFTVMTVTDERDAFVVLETLSDQGGRRLRECEKPGGLMLQRRGKGRPPPAGDV